MNPVKLALYSISRGNISRAVAVSVYASMCVCVCACMCVYVVWKIVYSDNPKHDVTSDQDGASELRWCRGYENARTQSCINVKQTFSRPSGALHAHVLCFCSWRTNVKVVWNSTCVWYAPQDQQGTTPCLSGTHQKLNIFSDPVTWGCQTPRPQNIICPKFTQNNLFFDIDSVRKYFSSSQCKEHGSLDKKSNSSRSFTHLCRWSVPDMWEYRRVRFRVLLVPGIFSDTCFSDPMICWPPTQPKNSTWLVQGFKFKCAAVSRGHESLRWAKLVRSPF